MPRPAVAAILFFAGALLGAWQLWAQGPVAADVAMVRLLQSWLGGQNGAALIVTETAKPPYIVMTAAFAAILAGAASGLRAVPAVALSYAGAWGADKVLRALIFSPRPAPDLVDVAAVSASSGLPSTLALLYASLFGVALFAGGTGGRAFAVRVAAAAIIAVGLISRAALGGHWPSQLLASAATGLAIAALAVAATGALFRKP